MSAELRARAGDATFCISLPVGWTLSGCLPILEPYTMSEDGLFSLGEDICCAWPPDERFIVDVGWYPEVNVRGGYRCVVVTKDGLPAGTDNPWHQDPVEVFETRSTAEVWSWLARTVSKIHHEHYRKAEK